MAKEFRPHMSKEVFQELIALYPNQDKEIVLNRAVSSFLFLRKLTTRKLKGVFTKQELTGIIAAMNGVFVDFGLGISPKDMLKIEMEDSISLNRNDEMYEYSANSLFEKIESLDDLEAMVLLEECYRFWDNNSRDLQDFLEDYQ